MLRLHDFRSVVTTNDAQHITDDQICSALTYADAMCVSEFIIQHNITLVLHIMLISDAPTNKFSKPVICSNDMFLVSFCPFLCFLLQRKIEINEKKLDSTRFWTFAYLGYLHIFTTCRFGHRSRKAFLPVEKKRNRSKFKI